MRNNQDRLGQQTTEHSEPVSTESTFKYVVPTHLVSIPSKGAYYPAGHPLHLKEEIEIKEMTAREEDILYNRSFIEKGIVLDKLLESIIVDKTIRPDSLLIIDKNALFVAARVSGYGAQYDVETQCIKCGSKFDAAIDLSNLLAIDEAKPPEGAIKHENGTVELELPVTKWRVAVKLLTGGEQNLLTRILEKKKKNNQEENAVLETMRSFIYSINGSTEPMMLAESLYKMPARDSKFLRTQYSNCFPNVKTTAPVTCTVCDSTEEVDVPFNANFFWTK
jgi:hypothetical protein